jgi:periplasmic protein TonB
MNDSTARATRFEDGLAAPVPAECYLWTPPGRPVSVAIPLTLIAPLERAAVESFRSLSSRGSEIGGVLFGSFAPGSPLAVTIESYEPVECEYASGPLYRLSDGELARLDRAIELRATAGVRPVGFYRSHTRKGLSLDAADLALFDSRFKEAHQIALVIRPAASKASVAGIFIREDGVVRGDASCLEFPFRATQDGAKPAPTLYDSAVAGPRSVAAMPASAPRPVIRAQIVPIASRREAAPEPPLPAPIAAAPEPVVEPVAVTAPIPEPPAAVPEPPKAVVPEPKPAVKSEAKSKAKSEPKSEAKIEPKPAATAVAEAEPRKSGSSKLLWIALGALASVIVCVGFVLSSGMLHRGNITPPGSPQDSSQLALRVDRNGADVVITWNRESEAVKKADHAVLSISDGPQHENVEMDLAQLRTGSIVYTPVTGDVVFKMEVSRAGQPTTGSESVRVLRTRPSPLVPENSTEQAQNGAAAPTKPVAPADATAAGAAPGAAPAEEEEKPVRLAQASKPFHAESLAQRLRPGSPSEVPDAPAIGGSMPAQAPAVNLGSLGMSQAPPPASTAKPTVPTTAAPAAAPHTGGQIVQAQLIKRRDPEYPKMARETGASGVVELVATVGADGKVKSVQIVKGHPLLRQAAADAVKFWIYRPTTLNGVAVESQTQILLNFKSDR